jgi:hypothetical protein
MYYFSAGALAESVVTVALLRVACCMFPLKKWNTNLECQFGKPIWKANLENQFGKLI